MSERKLASVQKITDIRPIEGADKIETAQVLGWECVVRKGEFKIGDLIIFIEIDSILTEKLLKLANLWDSDKSKGLLGGGKGDRLKTRKMKGVVSQGLIINISILENY